MTPHSDGIYRAAETPTNGVVSAEQATADRAEAFWNITRLVESFDSLDNPPSLLDRDDGQILFYAGRTNSLFGKPGTAKSYIAILVMVQAMRQGGRVVLVDYEDLPTTLYERTFGMGIEGQFMEPDAFRYLDHELFAPEQQIARLGAIEWLKGADHPEYSLVVIDAAESAGCPSDGAPVTEWIHERVYLWSTEGLGVLLIDHLPKRKTIGDDVIGPIGSQAKLASITGAALEVKGTAWTRKRPGQVSLVVHKGPRGIPSAAWTARRDRHGRTPGGQAGVACPGPQRRQRGSRGGGRGAPHPSGASGSGGGWRDERQGNAVAGGPQCDGNGRRQGKACRGGLGGEDQIRQGDRIHAIPQGRSLPASAQ